jgi:hypothetical protein
MAAAKQKQRFKSIESAERRIRLLEKRFAELDGICDQYVAELKAQKKVSVALAKLASKGPAFSNPLDAWEAEQCRDLILSQCGLNPDGTVKQ